MNNQNQEEPQAVKEFKDIRQVLRVPFKEDMRDLVKDTNRPEFPEERKWKGPCLGYQEKPESR